MPLFQGSTMNAEVNTGVTIYANRFIKFVGVSSNGGIPLCDLCGANEQPDGVAITKGTAGNLIDFVPVGSWATVEASEAIDASSGPVNLTTAALGKAQVSAPGEKIAGKAFTSASGSGYLVRALIMGGYILSEELGYRTIGGALGTITANTTTRFNLMVAAKNFQVVSFWVAWHAIPASVLGAVTGILKFYDASANAEVDMMDAAKNLETITAKEGSEVTLNDHDELDDGDTLYFEAVSDNADMTGGTGGSWGAVILELE